MSVRGYLGFSLSTIKFLLAIGVGGKFLVEGGNIELRLAGRFEAGTSRGKLTSIVELTLRPICFAGDFAVRGGFLAVDVCPPNDLIDENILRSFCELAIENLPLLDAIVLTDSVLYDSLI